MARLREPRGSRCCSMSKCVRAASIALLLSACAYNSGVQTTESWTEATPQQAVGPAPQRIDAFAAPIERAPRMRNGCATSVTNDGEVVLVKHVHPREVYCVRVAPLRLTTIELPAGAQITSAQSGMMDFITLASADAGGRTTLALQSKCLPLREKDGQIVESDLHRFIAQSSLPFCPRSRSDLVVLTTSGPMYFRLIFNETTRTRLVDVRSEPLVGPERPSVPTKPADAQDLYAKPLDGAMVPWFPD